MTILEIAFDAQTLNDDAFHEILSDGILLRTCGLINLRWDDFSAQKIASDLGLKGIVWEITRDDTPGTLSCLIFYPDKTRQEIKSRLKNDGIIEHDLA